MKPFPRKPLQDLKQNAMKKEIKLEKALAFFKRNWFQIALVLLGLYVFFIKDLRLNINVQVPDNTEKPFPAKSREKYTDATPALADKATVTDRMEVPFIGAASGTKNARTELAAIDESVKHEFLERFARVAVTEQQKYGIPASVILATALHQSFAGNRDLSTESNNFFALPCTGGWKGGCENYQGRRYRRYATAWESFRDFSLFARENFSYLKGENFSAWASGMQKAGFAENDDFAKNIVSIIEGYRLTELDR